MASSIRIICEGFVGLHIGCLDVGVVAYKTEADGHISFNKERHKEFHRGQYELRVGKVVLLSTRTTTHKNFSVMFVIDII
jgi:hypothetical protein